MQPLILNYFKDHGSTRINQEAQHSKLRFWKLCLFIGLVVFCTYVPAGYHFTIVNQPKSIVERFINESCYSHYDVIIDRSNMNFVWSITVASQGIGSIVGSLVAKFPLEHLGRKWTVFGLLSLANLIGSILLILSKALNCFELIIAGRFMIGIGNGFTYSTVSVYMLECTPASYRGMVGSLGFLGTMIGDAFARIIGTVADEKNWGLCFGATIVPAALFLLLSPFIPESPKFLLLQKHDTVAAEHAIGVFFGNKMVHSRAEKILQEEAQAVAHSCKIGLKEVLKNRVHRTPLFLSMTINACAASVGLFAMFSYSTLIFEGLGIGEELITSLSLALMASNLASGIVQVVLVMKVARRPLLLFTMGAAIISHVVFLITSETSLAYNSPILAYAAVGALFSAVLCTNLGVGTISIFLAAEITLSSARSTVATAGSFTRTVGIVVTQFGFNMIYSAIGNVSFVFFIVLTSVGLAYLYKELPETKGTTVHEIAENWISRKTGVANEAFELGQRF